MTNDKWAPAALFLTVIAGAAALYGMYSGVTILAIPAGAVAFAGVMWCESIVNTPYYGNLS